MWQAKVNGILGIWLIIAAFIKSNPTFGLWNNLIVGIVVVIITLTYTPLLRSWQEWVVGFNLGCMDNCICIYSCAPGRDRLPLE